MNASRMELSRRRFLEGLGLMALGVGAGVTPLRALAAESLQANPFVHIGLDGLVSIVCARSEMGQGVRSSLPCLIADELGAKLGDVRVVQGDGDKRYGNQNTDGSSSVRNAFAQLREAGATARTMLVQAAASQWRVDADSCVAQDSAVTHAASGRTLPFAALVQAAAGLPVPHTVVLRPRAELRHLGKASPLVDGDDIVTGRARFGADVLLPGMLTAVIQRPPAVGGAVSHVNTASARAVAGVRHVVTLPKTSAPYKFKPLGGVAVVADNTWAALRGRAALEIAWEAGPNSAYDSAEQVTAMRHEVTKPGKALRDKGDIEAGLRAASTHVEAVYHVPYQAHVPMEPPVAVAHVRGNTCEIWAPTQAPLDAKDEVGHFLGIDPENVTVHVTLLGGAFGRKAKPDFLLEAAWLSREVGAPVRVQWTREDDVQHDYYHSVSVQRLEAGLDARGGVTAWRHRTAFPPIGSIFDADNARGAEGDLQQGVLDFPLAAPNVRAEACTARAHTRIGWLRSVANIYHAFAVQSFIAEIAHARGVDHKEVVFDVIGPPRDVSLQDLGVAKLPNYGASLQEHPIDIKRMRHVVERVCDLSRWDTRHSDGRALGLAVHRSFLAYVAVVVHAVYDARKRVRIESVWLVADSGTILNLDRVKAQMEGAIVFGMGIAMHGAISMQNGATQQSNFRDFRLTRMAQAPRHTHIEIVESEGPPCGVGEPGVPPVAPAIANAIFALTGERIRDLPIDRVLKIA